MQTFLLHSLSIGTILKYSLQLFQVFNIIFRNSSTLYYRYVADFVNRYFGYRKKKKKKKNAIEMCGQRLFGIKRDYNYSQFFTTQKINIIIQNIPSTN